MDTIPEISVNSEMLSGILRDRKGRFCVAAKHFGTGEEILLNPDALCATASVFKVPVLIELMRRYQEGSISLDTMYTYKTEDISPGSGVLRELTPGLTLSIKDLATLMIIRSDNTATDILVDMLGAENITATMRALGMRNTYVTMGCKGLIAHIRGVKSDWPTPAQVRQILEMGFDAPGDDDAMTLKGVPENDVTTPSDMVTIFERMYHKNLLGPKGDEAAMAILLRQQINDRIPGLLPRGTIVAHKTGSLARRILNDAGVVIPKQGSPYAVAIFTDQIDPEGESEVLARISLAIYEHFQRKA